MYVCMYVYIYIYIYYYIYIYIYIYYILYYIILYIIYYLMFSYILYIIYVYIIYIYIYIYIQELAEAKHKKSLSLCTLQSSLAWWQRARISSNWERRNPSSTPGPCRHDVGKVSAIIRLEMIQTHRVEVDINTIT